MWNKSNYFAFQFAGEILEFFWYSVFIMKMARINGFKLSKVNLYQLGGIEYSIAEYVIKFGKYSM